MNRDGKIYVCHHIKGHIPLLVYHSFKPYQLNIMLPYFPLVTATSYDILLDYKQNLNA